MVLSVVGSGTACHPTPGRTSLGDAGERDLSRLGGDIRYGQLLSDESHMLILAVMQTCDAVMIADAAGIIQFVNPAAVDLLGYADASDLVGQSAYEKFHHAFENGAPMPRSACFLNQCYTQGSQVPNWQTVFIS